MTDTLTTPHDPRYCTECGREIRTMAFRRTPWCCENCRKSSTGEGPKVDVSQEFIDRNVASGHIVEFTPDRFEEMMKERDSAHETPPIQKD